jgi:protein-disulfide isomerase
MLDRAFAVLARVLAIGVVASSFACKSSERRNDRPADSASLTPKSNGPAITDLEDLDLSTIPPEQRNDALRLLNETSCYCGCPRTLASCLANKKDCSCVKCSERMADFVVNEYKTNASTEDVEAQLLEGFAEGYNAKQLSFDEGDQPIRGAKDAPFTIVEFADFRCPHCAAAYEELEDLFAKRNDAKLVYYYFPLGGFNAELSVRAAEAAEEARAQGKFWELAKVMFKEQHALEEADLERYAQQVGLDMLRFKAAMAARTHRDKVMKDKRLGESMGIKATPTLYVNGRPFGLGRTAQNLEMRFAMESERGRCE